MTPHIFEIGFRFTLKNSRDSFVYQIDKINYSSGSEPMYELKPIGSCSNRISISQSTLKTLYRKIETETDE